MVSSSYKQSTIVALLLAGAFIAILNQTLMITAIAPIMEEMGITANTAQWLTTVFLLVSGIMIPVSAFLLERFTTRQLFITAMSVFAFGTLVAGLAPNFEVLLLGRVIQSSGAGVMLPLMQTVFLMIFPVHRRGAAMGLIGLVISFAPAIGPSVSGWVTANYSWRLLFFIILPIALIDIIIAFFALRNVTDVTRPKVDILSIVLSSFGFGGLLYGFTSAGNYGWESLSTILSLGLGGLALFLFITRQLRLDHPMLEFRVFKYPVFSLAVVIGMIVFIGLIGVETIIPLYMQNMRDGFTALEAGLAILPGALISGFMAPVTGRIFDRIGARLLSIVGLSIITVASFALATLGPATSFAFIAIMYSLRMFGLAMVLAPISTAALNQLPKRLIAHGAAMDNTMKMVAASVGTAALITTMTSAEESAAQGTAVAYPDIYGANVALMVVAVLSMIGIILSFFVKNSKGQAEAEENEEKRISETGSAIAKH